MTEIQHLSRKEIVERAATALFQRKGYAATTMRDIAADLGMEAASLYSHIRSKEEILQKICFDMAEDFFASIARVEKTGTGMGQLKSAIEGHVKILTRDKRSAAVFLTEWRHLSQPFSGNFLAMRNEYEGRLRQMIALGIDEGDIEPMDEKFAVLTVISAMNWLPYWYREEGKMNESEIAGQISKIILTGLQKK